MLEALQVALDLGADVNAVDRNGETAMHAAAYKNLPNVVKFLAAHGAKIDRWNRPDAFGWTPLAIAVGYRFGNFKPPPETEAAVREVMIAAGVTPPKTVTAKTQQIYRRAIIGEPPAPCRPTRARASGSCRPGATSAAARRRGCG